MKGKENNIEPIPKRIRQNNWTKMNGRIQKLHRNIQCSTKKEKHNKELDLQTVLGLSY